MREGRFEFTRSGWLARFFVSKALESKPQIPIRCEGGGGGFGRVEARFQPGLHGQASSAESGSESVVRILHLNYLLLPGIRYGGPKMVFRRRRVARVA